MKKTPGYYLSYAEETFTLSLHVHVGMLPKLNELLHTSSILRYWKDKEPEFAFESDMAKNIGFSGCAVNAGIRDDFIVFDFLIPEARYLDDQCSDCAGSGRNKYHDDMACFFCKGSKHQIFYGKELRWAICLTLEFLFWCLEKVLSSVPDEYAQHAVLVSRVARRQGQMSLGGGVSEAFFNASKKLYGTEDFESVRIAMTKVWCRMQLSADEKNLWHENRVVHHSSGKLYLECHGENGCSVTMSRSMPYFFEQGGGALNDHNIDNPQQQLTLLIGFAQSYGKIIEHMQKESV